MEVIIRATGRWSGTRSRHLPGVLALLVMLAGCASASVPADYENKATGAQVPASRPQPTPSPLPSGSPVQPPVTRAQPPAPVKLGTGVRTSSGTTARLLNIPAAILAMLLWPSTLEGETLPMDWTNTLNPVTLAPWNSQEEYDQFWQLPQQERERLIQASRKAMGDSKPSGAAAESRFASRAGSRRNPTQTCNDSVLDHLQAEKNRICKSIPGESCSRSKTNPKRLDKMPCSVIRLRVQALRNCINIRQFIQDECFGGVPDTRHEMALKQYNDGLVHCLAVEAENCAPGHPMVDL
ncbi:hypothetical protein [Archangium sp.]|uniref:hypothetical protein n=1 Tax=Archangium sp. TaxID=1872627 RepID=UPI002D54D4BE|nr:hypothetical protein [Archangium sp.]HYO51954.1 hypothetical protein [Archangium sp.]